MRRTRTLIASILAVSCIMTAAFPKAAEAKPKKVGDPQATIVIDIYEYATDPMTGVQTNYLIPLYFPGPNGVPVKASPRYVPCDASVVVRGRGFSMDRRIKWGEMRMDSGVLGQRPAPAAGTGTDPFTWSFQPNQLSITEHDFEFVMATNNGLWGSGVTKIEVVPYTIKRIRDDLTKLYGGPTTTTTMRVRELPGPPAGATAPTEQSNGGPRMTALIVVLDPASGWVQLVRGIKPSKGVILYAYSGVPEPGQTDPAKVLPEPATPETFQVKPLESLQPGQLLLAYEGGQS